MSNQQPPVDLSKLSMPQLIEAVVSAQKEAADNLELAKLSEKKADDLSAELEDAKSSLKAVDEVNDELTKKIEEMSKVKTIPEAVKIMKEKKVPSIPASEFTVKGKSYKFISPVFVFKKQRIVAAEVINDQEKLNELVAAGVGSIVEA